MKRGSTSLILREMQIKATMRGHYTSTRITTRETILMTPNAGEDVEKLISRTLLVAAQNCTPENSLTV